MVNVWYFQRSLNLIYRCLNQALILCVTLNNAYALQIIVKIIKFLLLFYNEPVRICVYLALKKTPKKPLNNNSVIYQYMIGKFKNIKKQNKSKFYELLTAAVSEH